MSMRGELIAGEYQRMVWLKDENGKEYSCYGEAIQDSDRLDESEKANCLDTSLILGDSW